MAKESGNNATYQELNEQLDQVMLKLQDPNVAIDDAVHYYEQAMRLIHELEQRLDMAETKVREIRAQFSENDQ